MFSELEYLRGNFVFLRKIVESDAPVTFEWRNSQHAKFMHEGAKSVSEQRKWIQNRPSNEVNFVIESYETGPCGMYSLVAINEKDKSAEQSRLLIPNSPPTKPYVVEAMKIVLSFGFEYLNLNLITGKVLELNTRVLLMHEYFGNSVDRSKYETTEILNEKYPLVNIALSRETYFKITQQKLAQYLIKYE
jgi:RimJ/RimL family protein N-acetyltransferase